MKGNEERSNAIDVRGGYEPISQEMEGEGLDLIGEVGGREGDREREKRQEEEELGGAEKTRRGTETTARIGLFGRWLFLNDGDELRTMGDLGGRLVFSLHENARVAIAGEGGFCLLAKPRRRAKGVIFGMICPLVLGD